MRRCTKCLMPDTYPDVTFDSFGVCNHCTDYVPRKPLGEEAFLELLRSEKGAEYDCVLGISGGKDSCYVAYLAKKRFGLKPLAVCYDFPFLCDLARQNIKRVCSSLDIDLQVIKSEGNLEYELMRNHFLSVCATGTTWGQCTFCHYGIAAILQDIAVRNKIPFILGGITKYELWNPGSRTKFLMQRVKRLPVGDIVKFFYHQSKAFASLVKQRRQFRISGNSIFDVYRRAESSPDGPTNIHVFDYLPWDQDMIEKTLAEKTGWVKPAGTLSWRYDCSLEPFLDCTYKREFSISTVGIYLSGLIRDGGIQREEALVILENNEDEMLMRNRLTPVLDYLKIPARLKERFLSGGAESSGGCT